jgi:MFS family permease
MVVDRILDTSRCRNRLPRVQIPDAVNGSTGQVPVRHPEGMTERLSRETRRLLVGTALSAFGFGLTLPLLLIYLHRVRGIPLPTVGLLMSAPALVGLFTGVSGGVLVDRWSARRVMAVALFVEAACTAGIAFVHAADTALPIQIVFGLSSGVTWPAQSSLFGQLAEGKARQRLFAVQFVILNAGIGLGGLVCGLVADVHHPATFVGLLLGTSGLSLVYLVFVLSVRPSAAVGPPADVGVGPGGYREVLADRTFRQVLVVTGLLAIVGYTEIDTGLPAFATVVDHQATSVVAYTYAVNTALIVAAQLLVLRRMQHVRRTRTLIGVAALWAAAWAVLGASAVLHAAAAALVIGFGAVFGIGETLMSPTVAPLVNDLAPDHLRGRYNALSSMPYQVGAVVAPALSAAMIAAGLAEAWIGLIIGGCAVVAFASWRLERRLTPAQNGLPVVDQAQALVVSTVRG